MFEESDVAADDSMYLHRLEPVTPERFDENCVLTFINCARDAIAPYPQFVTCKLHTQYHRARSIDAMKVEFWRR